MEEVRRKESKVKVIPLSPMKREFHSYNDLDAEFRKNLTFQVIRNTGSNSDLYAEDIVQEAFLRLFENIGKVDRLTVHRYLGVISGNLVTQYASRGNCAQIDQRKYDSPIKSEDADDGVDSMEMFDYNSVMIDLGLEHSDPGDILHHDLRAQVLDDRISQMSESNQRLIHLIFREGYTPKEASAIMDISYANTRKRVQRIRESLREFYENEKKDFKND